MENENEVQEAEVKKEVKKPAVNGNHVKTSTMLLLIIVVALLFALAGYLVGANKTIGTTNSGDIDLLTATVSAIPSSTVSVSVSATSTPTDVTANWKTYTNDTYGFSFKHPTNLTIGSQTNEEVTLNSDNGNGHWELQTDIKTNPGGLNLSQFTTNEINSKIGGAEASTRNTTISDLTVGGKTAKKFSIANIGDYGNVEVIIFLGNNALVIQGDDSSKTSADELTNFLSTFQFTK